MLTQDATRLTIDGVLQELGSMRSSLTSNTSPKTQRSILGRITAYGHLLDYLQDPFTDFENRVPAQQAAAEALDALTHEDDDDVIAHLQYDEGRYWDEVFDPRVEGTTFTFIGSGSHRYAYLDTNTNLVYKRLRNFGNPLLEEAFWAEERMALKNFKMYEKTALTNYYIRYADTTFHRLKNGRTYMIQEYFPLTREWLDSTTDFITEAQEEFLNMLGHQEGSGISFDLCSANCAQDQHGNLVLLDMLRITYNAYLGVA